MVRIAKFSKILRSGRSLVVVVPYKFTKRHGLKYGNTVSFVADEFVCVSFANAQWYKRTHQ